MRRGWRGWPSVAGICIVVDGAAVGIGRRVEEIVNFAKEVILLHGQERRFLLFSCLDHKFVMNRQIRGVDSKINRTALISKAPRRGIRFDHVTDHKTNDALDVTRHSSNI